MGEIAGFIMAYILHSFQLHYCQGLMSAA